MFSRIELFPLDSLEVSLTPREFLFDSPEVSVVPRDAISQSDGLESAIGVANRSFTYNTGRSFPLLLYVSDI